MIPGSTARWPSRSPSQPTRTPARSGMGSTMWRAPRRPSPFVEPTAQRPRYAPVLTGLRPKQHRHVEHPATHRTLGGQVSEVAVALGAARHPSPTRPHPEHVVPRRRVAQRAHVVAAVGHRDHRVASATAAPPLLPPAVRARSYGLRVTPNTSLNVCEPRPNSGTLVLPITMHPAAFMPRDHQRVGGRAEVRQEGDPIVVGTPAPSARSLIACGRPCIQPRDTSSASSSSHSLASASSTSRVSPADDHVHRRVVLVDAVEVGGHHLTARDVTTVDRHRQFRGGERGQLHHQGRLRPRGCGR